MSKIALNFFGEIISIEKPYNLDSLRKEISRLYCFSSQDAAEIILTYNENGDKLIISSDEDLKAFLNSKNSMIDLDISQSSQIYKDNLNQIKEETIKDKNTLEELLKKKDELNKLKETKFVSEREEIKKIQSKIMDLCKQKHQIRRKIMEGIKQIEKEKRENDKKIVELQKKMGIPVTKPEEKKKPEMKKMMGKKMNQKFVPPQIQIHNFQKKSHHHHR